VQLEPVLGTVALRRTNFSKGKMQKKRKHYELKGLKNDSLSSPKPQQNSAIVVRFLLNDQPTILWHIVNLTSTSF